MNATYKILRPYINDYEEVSNKDYMLLNKNVQLTSHAYDSLNLQLTKLFLVKLAFQFCFTNTVTQELHNTISSPSSWA